MKKSTNITKLTIKFILVLFLLTNAIPLKVYADLYTEDQILPVNYAGNTALVSNTQSINHLASVNWDVLDMNEYDKQKIAQLEQAGAEILKSKETNGELWNQYVNAGERVTPEMFLSMGINENLMSRYDIRTLESIIYLTSPKINGGAGREYLKVPTITRGYNVLPNKTNKTLKDNTAKEADQYAIENDDDALEHISAHANEWGQAVDISAIDYIRGTALVYDKDNKLVKKQKLDQKIPIQVAWQTSYTPENTNQFALAKPRGFNTQSILDAFLKGGINSAFNSLTTSLLQNSDLPIDISTTLPTNSDNIAQMATNNIALPAYLEDIGLPYFKPGYDLSKTGEKLGGIVIEGLSSGYLPQPGLYGNSQEELETNIGRVWIARTLGLADDALENTDSHNMIESVGKSIVAQRLNLSKDSLSSLSPGNASEVIGKGYIENNLNLAPGAMTKSSFSDLSQYIGNQKAQYIFKNPALIDKILGINVGETAKFTSGSISPIDYSKIVGDKVINEFKNAFNQDKYWDSIFGVSSGIEDLAAFGDDTAKQKDYIVSNYIFSDQTMKNCIGTSTVKAIDYFNNCYNSIFSSNQAALSSWLAQYTQLVETGSIPTDKKKQEIVKNLFDGNKNTFYQIGIKTLARNFASDANSWNYFENYLKLESDSSVVTYGQAVNKTPKLANHPTVNAIYQDELNKQYNLAVGDIERIFILDRANEVFQRIGRENFINAFNQNVQTDDSILAQKKGLDDNYYLSNFYPEKFQAILDNDIFKKLLKNPQSKIEANEILRISQIALNYKDTTEDDVKYKKRELLFINWADDIDKNLRDIKNKKLNIDISSIESLVGDLVAGKSIQNPADFKKEAIKENNSYYYVIFGALQNYLSVLKGDIKSQSYLQDIGLTMLADTLLEHPDSTILVGANQRIIQNYGSSLSTLENYVGSEFVSISSNIANNDFVLKDDLTLSNEDIVAFLNGATLGLESKIGSQIINNSYGINDFYKYLSGSTLTKPEIFKVAEVSASVASVGGLFDSNNIYNLGMELSTQSIGVDVKSFYQNPDYNPLAQVGGFVGASLGTVNMSADGKNDVSQEYIQYLSLGDLSGLSDRIQADTLAKTYQQSYPGIAINPRDFMPINELNTLFNKINETGFDISSLKIPGQFIGIIQNANIHNSLKPIELAMAYSFKNNSINLNASSFTNLFEKLLDPNFSKDDAINVYKDFINSSGVLSTLPDSTKSLVQSILTVDTTNPSSVANFITSVVSSSGGNVDPKTMNILNNILSISFSNGVNINSLTGLLNSIDPAILSNNQQLGNIFNSLNGIANSGEINLSNMTGLLNAIDPKILQNNTQLSNILGSLSSFANGSQINLSNMTGLLNAIDPKILQSNPQLTNIFNALNTFISNGQPNLSNLTAFVNAIDPKILQSNQQLGGILNALNAFVGQTGSFNIGQLPELIKTINPDILKNNPQLSNILVAVGSLMNNNQINLSNMTGLLNAIDPKILQNNTQLSGIMNALGGIISNGQVNLSNMTGLLNAIDPKILQNNTQLSGIMNALGAMMTNGQVNLSNMTGLLNAIDPKILQNNTQLTGILNTLGSIVNGGQINLSTITSIINTIDPKILANNPQLSGVLGTLATVFNGGQVTGQTFVSLLGQFNVLSSIPSQYQNMISGLLTMGLSGNINAGQVLTLGLQAAGISSIAIPGMGMVSVNTLMGAFSNPSQFVTTLVTQYITQALTGAIMATFGLPVLVAQILVSLLLGMIGGQGHVEYQYTACGYYPTYDKEEEIEGERYENELGKVNEAKAKALASNNPEDWGKYIQARLTYDTIPTDEIDEDDLQTQDIKYSNEAIANEQTEQLTANNLSEIVAWAKTKDNTMMRCMDKENGGGGIFTNESPELSFEQKQQIAKYKIRVFLGNLLRMQDRVNKTKSTNLFGIPSESWPLAMNSSDQDKMNIFDKILGIENVKAATSNTDYDDEIAKQTKDYKEIFRFNMSGYELRPSQIFTYGSDEFENAPTSTLESTNILNTDIFNVATGKSTLFDKVIKSVNSIKQNITNSAKAADYISPQNLEANDVTHFYVLRDKMWGDDFGSPGSQDISLASDLVEQGFSFNKRMYDRIHYGY